MYPRAIIALVIVSLLLPAPALLAGDAGEIRQLAFKRLNQGVTAYRKGLYSEAVLRLQELHVELNDDVADAPPLKLVRSRHRALSFRFDRPDAWRRQLPTRDNRTYPFRVLRAIYETAPGG